MLESAAHLIALFIELFSHPLHTREIGTHFTDILSLVDPLPEVRHKLKEIGRSHTRVLRLIMWNDDIKLFFHDLSHIDKIVQEFDVSVSLFFEKCICLTICRRSESVHISFDIDLE